MFVILGYLVKINNQRERKRERERERERERKRTDRETERGRERERGEKKPSLDITSVEVQLKLYQCCEQEPEISPHSRFPSEV